jgi:predicted nuclease of predicted toxin-antitoxin system
MQSAANSPKPPKVVTFFLDRSLGKKIFAGILRRAGVGVEIHDEYFPPDARDQEWLKAVGAKRWVVLTNDRRIRYRAIELAALLSSGARVLAFTRGNLSAEEMATIFLKALPRIHRFLNKNKGPFVAAITRGADVRMMVRGSATQ